ncbi:hypothetical protein HF521_003819 [Silurus meridionalis]|uniref:Uncharacterized protein n=1 Tax=Silurus meridionalis TaxID=175797 RepID=A0A8T0AZF7_SILME|nr:hypothetical protein HF521_003819 [Silurus meridionalis]
MKERRDMLHVSLHIREMTHIDVPQPPAPPVSRNGCMLRSARQEGLKNFKVHQPGMCTPSKSQWMTSYMESFGPPGDLPRAIRTTKPPLHSNFQNTTERCKEYQANYRHKKKQNCLPLKAENPATCNFQCKSQSKWMTNYTENFGFQRSTRLSTVLSSELRTSMLHSTDRSTGQLKRLSITPHPSLAVSPRKFAVISERRL